LYTNKSKNALLIIKLSEKLLFRVDVLSLWFSDKIPRSTFQINIQETPGANLHGIVSCFTYNPVEETEIKSNNQLQIMLNLRHSIGALVMIHEKDILSYNFNNVAKILFRQKVSHTNYQ